VLSVSFGCSTAIASSCSRSPGTYHLGLPWALLHNGSLGFHGCPLLPKAEGLGVALSRFCVHDGVSSFVSCLMPVNPRWRLCLRCRLLVFNCHLFVSNFLSTSVGVPTTSLKYPTPQRPSTGPYKTRGAVYNRSVQPPHCFSYLQPPPSRPKLQRLTSAGNCANYLDRQCGDAGQPEVTAERASVSTSPSFVTRRFTSRLKCRNAPWHHLGF
jgi:hypothetical protein